MLIVNMPASLPAANDLLAFTESQLVHHLESHSRVHGGFDISSAVGLENLSKSQRDALGDRLRAAAFRAKNTTASQSIDSQALLARLASIAGTKDSSSEPKHLRWPSETSETSGGTLSPQLDEEILDQVACYEQLVEENGKPVCSVEVLRHIINEPAASHEPVLPWLSDRLDGDIRTVLSRQLARWWEFRKWQSDNRGTEDQGFSDFLAAKRSRYEQAGVATMTESIFKETVWRLWHDKPQFRLLSKSQDFNTYKETVKKRLAPHNFRQPLKLLKNSRNQNEWTTWLEYVAFEQWWQERLADATELEEQQYRQAWMKLLNEVRWFAESGSEFHGANSAAFSLSSHTLAERTAAAQADLATARQTISDFIRDTEGYRLAEDAMYRQKIRVKWVLKQAQMMEPEVSQRRGTASTRANVVKSKKRTRNDDDIISSERKSKKARQEVGRSTVGGQPRRSLRLQNVRSSTRQTEVKQ
ncbi:hypothetical protein K458DRAFT_489826 [Lentithecium fluviatile CBS 122367]|uniref:Uncharacterized protein n=1 Tax=Lentithecium fluviatile CBS 122367 TaxID=1168545 RepID=A0A6G1IQX9_9PLEO|nr:hypothetical protein K458DRAFT_489826 [Lentithecium fluviatile CBS 122367]